MELYGGMGQEVPEEVIREQFKMGEKPCVEILRKKIDNKGEEGKGEGRDVVYCGEQFQKQKEGDRGEGKDKPKKKSLFA